MVQNWNRLDLIWIGIIIVMLLILYFIFFLVKSQELVVIDRDRVLIEMVFRINEIRVNILVLQYIVLVNVYRKQIFIIYKYLVFRLNFVEFFLVLFYFFYDKYRLIVLSLQWQQLVVELSYLFYVYRIGCLVSRVFKYFWKQK